MGAKFGIHKVLFLGGAWLANTLSIGRNWQVQFGWLLASTDVDLNVIGIALRRLLHGNPGRAFIPQISLVLYCVFGLSELFRQVFSSCRLTLSQRRTHNE